MNEHAHVESHAYSDLPKISVRRWATERPLFYLNALVAAALWGAFLVTSPQMVAWVAFLTAVMGMMHLALVAHVRGSAVRLGPDQFPDLYGRVEELSRRMGLRRTPEVYLMQQDGALNAFATRFLRTHMVVLLSDLLEACGDNAAARDMIIGHELGHIRAGHLFGHWLLLPASFVPFLGAALSRAREYTCDRYGHAAAGDADGACLGLAILAAGGKYGPFVNRDALARQRADLARGWMLVGEWLGSHPPLSRRLAALAPPPVLPAPAGAGRWLRPAFAVGVMLFIGLVSLSFWIPSLRARGNPAPQKVDSAAASAKVQKDLASLRSVIEADLRTGRLLPWDVYDVYERWEVHKDVIGPIDPFSGYWYEYDQRGGASRLWSVGPDGENRTKDDIVFDSRLE